ncbi:MAG TPA: Gfo/Idh/MocA family oxidoreductase, partial [Armatimonadota bacterium]|nr:Gfo/Idh/MocA family oxidoreductase [Armatimonadota bacterium]
LGLAATESLAARMASAQEVRPKSAGKAPVMGLIGCGGMGRGNMDNLMNHGIPFAAVCDVDERHMGAAAESVYKKQGRRPEQFKDFRKLLERKDIDAVVIATPDHWHALPFIYACEAGKDIHQEKPICHNITEGRAMVAAAKRNKRVVQVGTWQRSTREFVDAVDYIRSGRLGKVTTVRAWKTDDFRMGRNSPKPVPSELDYDFWVGPAEMIPYTGKNAHFDWRWYWNYAAGMTGDWGVHMMDIGLLAMSKDTDLVMPIEVSAYGGKLAWPDDDRTTPDTHLSIMRFPDFVMHWETGRRPVDSLAQELNNATQFIAADGSTLTVWRGGWSVKDPKGVEQEKTTAKGFNGQYDHMQNWLDCMVTREQPRSHLESMYQTTTVCHLANIAYLAGESVQWDKAKNDIVGKTGKNTLPYKREYRKPWSLPKYG